MAPSQSDPDAPPLPRPPAAPSLGDRVAAFRDRIADLIDDRWRWRALAGAIVVALAGVAVWAIVRPPTTGAPLEFVLPTVAPLDVLAPTSAPESLVVHVAGAVAQPGLVEVTAGSRVADAVAAAGGAVASADLDRINLALPLADADHVHVPAEGEPVLGLESDAAAQDGPIDLNRADEAALDELPGVGPATAAAIVAHREEHGPFTSVTSLQEVPGIGPAKLERLRDLVAIGP